MFDYFADAHSIPCVALDQGVVETLLLRLRNTIPDNGYYMTILDHAIAEFNIAGKRLNNLNYGLSLAGGRSDRLLKRMRVARTSWASVIIAVNAMVQFVRATDDLVPPAHIDCFLPPEMAMVPEGMEMDEALAHRLLTLLGRWASMGVPFEGMFTNTRFSILESVNLDTVLQPLY